MSNNEQSCKCLDCRYCRRLKHEFEVGKGHVEGLCCVALANEEDGFVLEIDKNSYCEMFWRKTKI